ncbi:3',5'-cyclic adenosine monophosphate phosphodiesterase CpdA [subsurface metagenome]
MIHRKIVTFYLFYLFLLSSLFTLTQNNSWIIDAADESFDQWYFIAMGDNRNWDPNSTNIYRRNITESVIQNNPNLEFILHSGDMVNNGGEQDDWDKYYEDIGLALQNNVQFYYAVGNHEMYTYPLPDGSYGPIEMDFATYLANVEMPGNERYYSINFNQIHFIIINTDEYWEGSLELTLEQEDWIVDDLKANSKDFTVAMFHRPCYSVRSEGRVNDAIEIRKVLEPILIEYGVDLVFSGHDHYYYRTIREGVTHIVTGGAGAPLYIPTETDQAEEEDKYFAEYHYCNITVTEDYIKVETLVFDNNLEHVTIEDTIEFSLSSITEITTSPFIFCAFIWTLWLLNSIMKKKKNN